MKLLRKGKVEQTAWSHHKTDEKIQPYQFVALQNYLLQPQDWHALEGPWAVELQPEDAVDELPKELMASAQIAIAFPVFTDGRGYSHARQLRHFNSFKGELIATGDVRRDQIDFMQRVGFDSFECGEDIDVADWNKALTELRVAS